MAPGCGKILQRKRRENVMPPPRSAPTRRALTWWLGLMMLAGLAFGLNAERRPFGDDMFGHPLIVYFIAVGIGLLLLRVILQRPIPEILPERMLIAGCIAGIAAFLAG